MRLHSARHPHPSPSRPVSSPSRRPNATRTLRCHLRARGRRRRPARRLWCRAASPLASRPDRVEPAGASPQLAQEPRPALSHRGVGCRAACCPRAAVPRSSRRLAPPRPRAPRRRSSEAWREARPRQACSAESRAGSHRHPRFIAVCRARVRQCRRLGRQRARQRTSWLGITAWLAPCLDAATQRRRTGPTLPSRHAAHRQRTKSRRERGWLGS
mmetsp:Transcript_16849/g.28666  ORF Transcript_16849/g.28666 Transcript_16849/m.28666 type:complete len:214 (-) Transcript_16849:429-1070(-)